MEYFIGVTLALAAVLYAGVAGFGRDRAFYAVMVVIVASYYILFAVMSGSALALSVETAAFSIFALAAVIGFRTNLWLVAGALVGHGIFDLVHPLLITNAGVPAWWPMFCMSFDVVAGLYLAWLLTSSVPAARSDLALAHQPVRENA
jgi:hypothetical protein